MFASRLVDLFGIDIRTLAMFRLGLGTFIVVDLIDRFPDLEMFYTDFGVLPRGVLLERFGNKLDLSLHFLGGAYWVQSALFLIAGLLGLLLIVGYRTRLVTVLSWAMLASLHSRNYMVLQGGDVLLRQLLFWAMFLPLGASWSVDRALDAGGRPPPQRVLSAATVAVQMQMVMVYVFTSLLKTDPSWLVEGTAVYYALSIDHHATALARWLLGYPDLLRALAFTTLYLERFGPILFFVPLCTGPIRMFAVLAFMGMHVAFRVSLDIGLFSWISCTGLLVFIPTWFWDRIGPWLMRNRPAELAIYYDDKCIFCRKIVLLLRTFLILPRATIATAQSEPRIQAVMEAEHSWVVVGPEGRRHVRADGLVAILRASPLFWPLAGLLAWRPAHRVAGLFYESVARNRRAAGALTAGLQYRPLRWRPRWFTQIAVVAALAYVLAWNLGTLPKPSYGIPYGWKGIGRILRLDQTWNMFAPKPTTEDGWFVMPGRLRNGTEIDLHRWFSRPVELTDELDPEIRAELQTVSWQKPDRVAATYPSQRWRKYLMNLWAKRHQVHRPYFGRWLCRRWNRDHPDDPAKLVSFEIYYMLEETLPDREAPPKKLRISSHGCDAK